jgi:hypothetical protein
LANKKISSLDPVPALSNAAIFPMVQNGTTYRVDLATMLQQAGGGGTTPPVQANFVTAVTNAWVGDYVLNWTGGDVTLTSPILLQTTSNKLSFGLRGNGAKITSDFNDSTKPAITIAIETTAGVPQTGIQVRNFEIVDFNFRGNTTYKAALELRCRTSSSNIYSFHLADLTCEGHSDYAYRGVGSVFECVWDRLKSTGGLGGIWLEVADYNNNTDWGLPSAVEINEPNIRDGSANGIMLTCRTQYNEPSDVTVRGGYIVTMGGIGIYAPAGITSVDGTGFENNQGGYCIHVGYRGGLIRGKARGANPVPNAAVNGPGLAYLVYSFLASGKLILEDCQMVNENAGTGPAKICYLGGSSTGTVYLNRSGDNVVKVGNSHSSTLLDGFSNTTGISNGMQITGTNIPLDTTVSGTTTTSVTMNHAATSTASGVTYTFGSAMDNSAGSSGTTIIIQAP